MSNQIIVFMGISGCGKSTVAAAVAAHFSWSYLEGDDLHSKSNIDKMRSGQPLTERDRQPWLSGIAAAIDQWRASKTSGTVSCSALKAAHRRYLAVDRLEVKFVFLQCSQAVALQRSSQRRGHFASPTLVPSQCAALEVPIAGEPVFTVDAERPSDQVISEVESWIARGAPLPG